MSDCMYCTKNEALSKLMTRICEVDGFTLYLFNNQAYKARCILAFNQHIAKIAEIDDKDYAKFFLAVKRVSEVLTKEFSPNQINIGLFGDTAKHVHAHLVPKYEGELDFGTTFQMNPQPEVTLSNEELMQIIAKIKNNF